MLIAVSEETTMRVLAFSPGIRDLENSVRGCSYKRGSAVSLVGDVAALAIGQSDLPILV
jgi:hypothetical protein